MFKVFNAVLLLILVCVAIGFWVNVGCSFYSSIFPPRPVYRYGNEVMVIDGFHEGQTGVVVSGYDDSFGFRRGWRYTVKLDDNNRHETIKDYELRKKKD